MSLVSATSSAHSGVATNRLMPRMVSTIKSARPPSSPIRLNIRHHPGVDWYPPAYITDRCHGAWTARRMELYQGTSGLSRIDRNRVGLYLGTVFFACPALIDSHLTCPARPGVTYP